VKMKFFNAVSIILLLVVTINSCGPVFCGRDAFKTENGAWKFAVRDGGFGARIGEQPLTIEEIRQLPAGDPRRIPFLFAEAVTLEIQRGSRLGVITDYDEITKLGANDRVELYDGRLTLEYVRDGHRIQEVYRITKALISAVEPASCAE